MALGALGVGELGLVSGGPKNSKVEKALKRGNTLQFP